MDSVTIVRDIAAIILMATGTVFCITLTIGLFKILPSLGQSARNIERATESTAEALSDIAVASMNLKEATGYIRDAAKDVAEASRFLRLLGPPGAAANLASQGIGRLGQWIVNLLRR